MNVETVTAVVTGVTATASTIAALGSRIRQMTRGERLLRTMERINDLASKLPDSHAKTELHRELDVLSDEYVKLRNESRQIQRDTIGIIIALILIAIGAALTAATLRYGGWWAISLLISVPALIIGIPALIYELLGGKSRTNVKKQSAQSRLRLRDRLDVTDDKPGSHPTTDDDAPNLSEEQHVTSSR